MMTLANAGSVLARRQRYNAFLFSRANISNDGCDYDVYLFMYWECKRTGTLQNDITAQAQVLRWGLFQVDE